MSAPAITHGSLVDVRNVNQHKCVRLVIDIPAERAREIIDMFGWPTMVDPVPVAIARLIDQQREEQSASSKTQIPTAQPRQSTPAGAPQTYAKRLGMACTQPRFWMFMFEHTKRQFSVTNEEEAANVVRNYLGCKRRDTIVNTPAGNKARDLLADFDVWTRGILA
jgi:hypothetical protein